MLSVIILTKNSEKTIEECILSLLNQTIKPREIIVIDDGSKDKTLEIVSKYTKRYKNIKLIKTNGEFSVSKLRNLGIKKAKSKFIVFIDSDCIAERNLLEKYLYCFKKYDLVFGIWLPGDYKNVFEKFKAIEYYTFNKKKGKKREITLENFIPPAACNMGIRKHAFNKFLGFDEINYNFKPPSGEDVEFAWRWCNLGAKILFSPELKVIYKHHFTLGSFIRKAISYGKSSFVSRSLSMKNVQWVSEIPLPNFSDILLFSGVLLFNIFLIIAWYVIELFLSFKKYKKGIKRVNCLKTVVLLPLIEMLYKWCKFIGFTYELFKEKIEKPNLVRVVIKAGDKFLILKRKSGVYQFITGKIEENEHSKSAAIRELFEETGIKSKNVEKIGKIMRFEINKNKIKAVSYLCEIKNEKKIKLSEEHVSYRFLDFKKAIKTLTFLDDKQICIVAKNYKRCGTYFLRRVFNSLRVMFSL